LCAGEPRLRTGARPSMRTRNVTSADDSLTMITAAPRLREHAIRCLWPSISAATRLRSALLVPGCQLRCGHRCRELAPEDCPLTSLIIPLSWSCISPVAVSPSTWRRTIGDLARWGSCGIRATWRSLTARPAGTAPSADPHVGRLALAPAMQCGSPRGERPDVPPRPSGRVRRSRRLTRQPCCVLSPLS
jgi:hypothetical protein